MVIRLGEAGLKKAGFVYLLDLPEGRGEKGWCDLVCVEASLDDLANGGFVGVFFTHGMVLVLWGVDVILGNGYGI